jgi:hypothetical protein
MPQMLRGDQRRFLSFEDEQAALAAQELEYQRDARWRLEQSHIALARKLAIPQPPRAPVQGQPTRISIAATTLQQRAIEMRRKLRRVPLPIWSR